MSRLDNFEEILNSYEGRERDTLELLKAYVSSDARDIYDSLNPELQKKILKYFDCVKQTGYSQWPIPTDPFKCVEFIDDLPDYFDHYLLELNDLEEEELEEFSGRLDQILQLYELDLLLGESE